MQAVGGGFEQSYLDAAGEASMGKYVGEGFGGGLPCFLEPKGTKIGGGGSAATSTASGVLSSGRALELLRLNESRIEEYQPYTVEIKGVAEEGAKSRVETQVKMTLRLQRREDLRTSSAAAASSSNSTPFSRPRGWWKGVIMPRDNMNLVMVEPAVQHTSDLLRLEVQLVCPSRNFEEALGCDNCIMREKRSFSKKLRGLNSSLTVSDGISLEDQRKIVLINSKPTVDFTERMELPLSMRFTCYSRHHGERLGFCAYFRLYDYKNNLVGCVISPPVMIVDDHKLKQAAAAAAMTQQQQHHHHHSSAGKRFMMTDRSFSAPPQVNILPSSINSTPPLTLQSMTINNPSPFFSPQTHTHMNGYPNPNSSFPGSMSGTTSPTGYPVAEKIVPSDGPLQGGVEVTVLGSNLHSYMTVMFGTQKAEVLHLYDSSAAVVRVPAGSTPGDVPISINGVYPPGGQAPLFHYKSNNDKALYEIALQILGVKLTGHISPPLEVALRLVGNDQHQFLQHHAFDLPPPPPSADECGGIYLPKF